MDPNEALRLLRQALADAKAAADGDSYDHEVEAWQEVGELIAGLDGWLTSGGFLPREWEDV